MSKAVTTTAATRRGVLKGAAALGLAAALPGASTAPAAAAPGRQADPKRLTLALYGAPVNLDPHSAYDYRSAIAIRGPFEGLIALVGNETDKYVGVVAESWSRTTTRASGRSRFATG